MVNLFKITTIVLIAIFYGQTSLGQKVERHEKKLDSIITNLDRSMMKNLDLVHPYLHNIVETNEDRVFLFYGLIATHYKYDNNRKEDTNPKEYTPYYTAYRRSGVCRDFTALFKELCDRSNIPCVVATGRIHIPFPIQAYKFITGKSTNTTHAWNVVKYNYNWQLMDPTWSGIYETQKYYANTENGRKKYIGKVKRVERSYYAPDTDHLYAGRKADHPAFYTSNRVYSYKTVLKKNSKRKLVDSKYNYRNVLDSMANYTYYQFSNEFVENAAEYSKNNVVDYQMKYLTSFLDLKRCKLDRITLDMCKNHLINTKQLLLSLSKSGGFGFFELSQHITEVEEYMKKLELKESGLQARSNN